MMTVAQPLSAFIFVFLGFCFGVFFDLYRVLRRLSTPGQLLTATTDLLFWITYTVWVYIALLRLNSGEVRVFLLFSLAVGAAAYFLWFSRSLRRAWYFVLCRVISFVIRVNGMINTLLDTALRIIIWPYRVLHTYLLLPLGLVFCWLLTPLCCLLGQTQAWGHAVLQHILVYPKAMLKAVGEMMARLWSSSPPDK